ncbi:MAG: (Fe-S)-binding protein [Myxococcaceae bacterium]|nr:(Fe-S)-binding protein [Myxococcaceae bacterium]
MTDPRLDANARAYTLCAFCPKVCRFSCPVSESTRTESTSAWGKMNAAHLVQTGAAPLDAGTAKDLHACTGCGRCQDVCKHDNDVGHAVFAARGAATAQGHQPAGAASTLETFRHSGNPFGRDLSREVERFRPEAPVRHALFPGCSTLVKRPELVEAALEVGEAFGASLGLCRASNTCCGYPLYAAGDFEGLKAHARSLEASFATWPELVVVDPGCAYTFQVVYPRLGIAFPSRVRTLVEVLAEHLPHAPRRPPLDEVVAYHDSCHLGRGLGQYAPPRALLQRAVKQVNEGFESRAHAGCAGGGGLLPRTLPDTAVDVARRLATDVAPGGETVVTACPTSARMIERSGKRAEDLLLTLRRWLRPEGGKR